MLLAQKLLAPGPQLKHSGNVNPVLDTGPQAEPGVYLKGINDEMTGGQLLSVFSYLVSCCIPRKTLRREVPDDQDR